LDHQDGLSDEKKTTRKRKEKEGRKEGKGDEGSIQFLYLALFTWMCPCFDAWTPGEREQKQRSRRRVSWILASVRVFKRIKFSGGGYRGDEEKGVLLFMECVIGR
jgi:hypothetical protein